MNVIIKNLKNERQKLFSEAWVIRKVYDAPEDYDIREKMEKELDILLEKNRKELFKLTNHPKYHEDEELYCRYSRLFYWLEGGIFKKLFEFSIEERDSKYVEYISKVEDPEKHKKYLSNEEEDIKRLFLSKLIAEVRTYEMWKEKGASYYSFV